MDYIPPYFRTNFAFYQKIIKLRNRSFNYNYCDDQIFTYVRNLAVPENALNSTQTIFVLHIYV